MSEKPRPAWLSMAAAAATIVCSVVVTGIWKSVDELIESIHSLIKTQAVIQSQVLDVRSRLTGLYTERQADREHALIYRTDQDQYKRIAKLEQSVAAVRAMIKTGASGP